MSAKASGNMRVTASGLAHALVSMLPTGMIWVAYIAATVLHAYLRGAADDLGPPAYSPAGLEHLLFSGIPSVWLQRWIPTDIPGLAWFALGLYGSWFYGLTLLAVLVLVRCGRQSLAQLLTLHLLLFFSADAAFILFPTRPPWMDFEVTRLVNFVFVDAKYVDNNPVAAVPSLHVALPALYALWFARQHDWLLRRLAPILALWTVGIAWAIVYGGEHYVVDVLAGVLWAGAAYLVFQRAVILRPWAKLCHVLRPGIPAGRRRPQVPGAAYHTSVDGIAGGGTVPGAEPASAHPE